MDGTWARTNLPAALVSATYDAANQLAQWGATTVSYDANGSLANDGTRSYMWNARNQLAALSGGVSSSFQYDGLGRRRTRTVVGSTTNFLYDGLNLIQELSGGTPTANLLLGLQIDEIFARTDSAGQRGLLADALGSTIALADSAGAVLTTYTYEPFGKTSPGGANSSNTSQFTGRENDGTSLYYHRARYYQPEFQRFAREDPVRPLDVNRYQYVYSAPVMFRDPLGLWGVTVFGGFGGSAVYRGGVEGSFGGATAVSNCGPMLAHGVPWARALV